MELAVRRRRSPLGDLVGSSGLRCASTIAFYRSHLRTYKQTMQIEVWLMYAYHTGIISSGSFWKFETVTVQFSPRFRRWQNVP